MVQLRYGCGHRTRTLSKLYSFHRACTLPSVLLSLRIFKRHPFESRTIRQWKGILFINGEEGLSLGRVGDR